MATLQHEAMHVCIMDWKVLMHYIEWYKLQTKATSPCGLQNNNFCFSSQFDIMVYLYYSYLSFYLVSL